MATFVDLKGATGDTGAQGDQGIQGDQGVQGEQGTQGPSGVTVSETEPISPSVGDVWFKASTGDLKVCTAV